MIYVLWFVSLVAVFYGGIILGIKDCKRRYMNGEFGNTVNTEQ